MKTHENSHAAGFARQLDNAIGERDRQREQKLAAYAKQRVRMVQFVERASVAVKLAVEAINTRADELGFDSPAAVEISYDFTDDAELTFGSDSLSASIKVSMSRPRLDRNMCTPDRGPSAFYNWELHTHVRVGGQGESEQPGFSIEASRNGWQDSWRCDLPTPECNPAGLSLAGQGDDVARRFMAWFTTYLV